MVAACGACPGRRPSTSRLASAPRKGRAGRPAPGSPYGRPRLPGGLLVAGQLSGREGDVRARKRGADAAGERPGSVGRGPSRKAGWPEVADAWAAVAVVAAAAPVAPSGSSSGWPKMAALPAQGFLSPSQWAGPQKKGEDARATDGARKKVAETDLTATPLPQPAPLALPPDGAGNALCASAVACPRLPRGSYCAGSPAVFLKGALGLELSPWNFNYF